MCLLCFFMLSRLAFIKAGIQDLTCDVFFSSAIFSYFVKKVFRVVLIKQDEVEETAVNERWGPFLSSGCSGAIGL